MQRCVLVLCLSIICCLSAYSQGAVTEEQTKPTYKFHGFIRNEIYVNSRKCFESAAGMISLLPLDVQKDAEGKDLNAEWNGSFLALNSRLGFTVDNVRMLGGKFKATIEGDFVGNVATAASLFRLRHAFAQFDSEKIKVLFGQTWHPMFGETLPFVINFNAGAPTNPLNRCAQLRFDYKTKVGRPWVALSTISSNIFQPEFIVGMDFKFNNWSFGGAAEYVMQSSSFDYRLDVTDPNSAVVSRKSTMGGFNGLIFGQYKTAKWGVNSKVMCGQNMNHLLVWGGYAYTKNEAEKETNMIPLSSFMSNISAYYGTKWMVTAFAGYNKTIGTTQVADFTAGRYQNIDAIFKCSSSIGYVYKWLNVALECEYTMASYGSFNGYNITPERLVDNVRLLMRTTFSF